jgi:hypothetical protein
MSENPPSGPHYGPGAGGFPAGHGPTPPTGRTQWPSPAVAPPRPGRLPTLAVLVIALVGVGAGVSAWFRPIPNNNLSTATPTVAYTAQQADDAKSTVCTAYSTVNKVVTANTHRTNPAPGDEVGSLATGIYGPVSLYDGGNYLLRALDDEPATPQDLAKSIKSLSKTLQKLAMVDLAGEPDSVRDALRHDVDSDVAVIEGLCK